MRFIDCMRFQRLRSFTEILNSLTRYHVRQTSLGLWIEKMQLVRIFWPMATAQVPLVPLADHFEVVQKVLLVWIHIQMIAGNSHLML